MTRILASLVMLTLVTGLVESALDLGGIVTWDDHAGGAHEVHVHLGSDDGSAPGGEEDVEHFCHCVTHSPALAFSLEITVAISESRTSLFSPNDYRSLAIPPPVPPPNA